MKYPRMTEPTQRVLRELLDDPTAEKYGLEICKAVGLAPGTVHPLLYKFEDIGWLESRFEEIDPSEAGRPRRRYYRLTRDGAELVRDALARAQPSRVARGSASPSTRRGRGVASRGTPSAEARRRFGMIMAAVVLSVIGLALTLALCRASPAEGAVVGERAGAERRRRKREWRALLANLFEPSRSGHVPSAHFLLAIAVRLLPPSKHDRYLEEFRAELLDVPRDTQLRHALSLLRGTFVVRLRRGLKKAADAAAGRRAKG